MGGILLAWLAEVGIITWRDLTGKAPNHTVAGLPIPADYMATFLVFGTLGLVPRDNVGASRAATLTAWAFVIATYLNVAPSILNPTGTGPTRTATGQKTSTTSPATGTPAATG